MIIDTLVFDRAQEDVDRVFTLKKQILMSGLSSLTDEEKAEYMGGLKGAYNAADLNRVGEAVDYLAGRFLSLPTELEAYREEEGVADAKLFDVPYDPDTVVVSAKTDWGMADIPTQSQADTYLANLAVLRKQLALPENAPAVPASLDHMTYTTANDIEYLLWLVNAALVKVENDLYDKIGLSASSSMCADEVYCGE